jgi:hypothetical protein
MLDNKNYAYKLGDSWNLLYKNNITKLIIKIVVTNFVSQTIIHESYNFFKKIVLICYVSQNIIDKTYVHNLQLLIKKWW